MNQQHHTCLCSLSHSIWASSSSSSSSSCFSFWVCSFWGLPLEAAGTGFCVQTHSMEDQQEMNECWTTNSHIYRTLYVNTVGAEPPSTHVHNRQGLMKRYLKPRVPIQLTQLLCSTTVYMCYQKHMTAAQHTTATVPQPLPIHAAQRLR